MCLAIPGELIEIIDDAGDPLTRTGRVNFGGILKQVNLAYVPEVQVGDYVNVHVGFAMSVVDADEAQKVFEYLREIGELNELETDVEPGHGAEAASGSDGAVPTGGRGVGK